MPSFASQRVKVTAIWPDGRTAHGGWEASVLRLHATAVPPAIFRADADGAARIDLAAASIALIPTTLSYRITLHGFDERRVRWTGSVDFAVPPASPTAVLPEIELRISVDRERHESPSLGLEQASVVGLDVNALGKLILYDVSEMLAALYYSLPSAALSLSGKVLDGLIKFKGQSSGWWPAGLDSKPLGVVLGHPVVKARIESDLGPEAWERLSNSFLYLRNTGAHQKFVPVNLPDAESSVALVLDMLSRWVR
jgi:hypothetical protein